MTLLTLPECVYIDLRKFINTNYSDKLPHSLLIAQAFILKHQEHGKEFGLSAIANEVEFMVKYNIL